MPIIIPVETPTYEPSMTFEGGTQLTLSPGFLFQVAASFEGGTALSMDLGLTMLERMTFAGSTALQLAAGLQLDEAIAFEGSTLLTLNARLNGEPNVFPEALFAGGTALTIAAPKVVQAVSAIFIGGTAMTMDLLLDKAAEFGFTIFCDVIDTAIASAQAGRIRRVRARLIVDGETVPIRKAVLTASDDTLGIELKVTLARPDVSVVTFESSITFQVGVWTGAAYQYVTVMSEGKLSSFGNAVRNKDSLPTDEVTISIIDVIADRWNRAPRAPIHLYDSNRVSAPTESEIASQLIYVIDGGTISPVNIGIAGMRLRDVLIRAYVNGTGFTSVVTNIPNFPVRQADFTLDGGFDAGVRPLLELFSPLFFTDQNNNLFIIDPDAPLPAGFTARTFAQSVIRDLSDTHPQNESVNAILLSMQVADTGGEFFTERLAQENTTAGVFGTPGYTETDITRRIREWRTIAEPLVIVREEIIDETTEVVDYQFNPIETSVIVQHFDALRRKTGYTRTIARRLPDLENDGELTFIQEALKQQQTITYKTNPFNSSQDIQDRVTTVESGLILVDDGNKYLGESYRIPLTDAHASGYVDPDGDQHTEFGDIRTTTEQLRVRGGQVDVEISVINHLSNAPARTQVTSRPGGVTIDREEQGASERTVLLTIPGTDLDGRRAQTFSAGDLPSDVALDLATRKLSRLNDAPRQVSINAAFYDLSIRRGSVLRPLVREDAVLGTYIVTGYSVTIGEYTEEQGAPAIMTITARELKA